MLSKSSLKNRKFNHRKLRAERESGENEAQLRMTAGE